MLNHEIPAATVEDNDAVPEVGPEVKLKRKHREDSYHQSILDLINAADATYRAPQSVDEWNQVPPGNFLG